MPILHECHGFSTQDEGGERVKNRRKKAEQVMRLRNEIRSIERQIDEISREIYPAGSTVQYNHGRRVREATVISNNGARLWLTGRTGAKYALDTISCFLFDAHGPIRRS